MRNLTKLTIPAGARGPGRTGGLYSEATTVAEAKIWGEKSSPLTLARFATSQGAGGKEKWGISEEVGTNFCKGSDSCPSANRG